MSWLDFGNAERRAATAQTQSGNRHKSSQCWQLLQMIQEECVRKHSRYGADMANKSSSQLSRVRGESSEPGFNL